MMPPIMKQLYFRRALAKKGKAPKRLPRQLYPAPQERAYERELVHIVDFTKSVIDRRIKPLLPRLTAYYGKDRKDAADETEPKKYYAAFIYDRHGLPDVLHCTHHYLGELDSGTFREVEKIVDGFFIRDRELPRVAFDRIDYFGPEANIRVLRPQPLRDQPEKFLPALKAKLDAFRKDDFPVYKPHVTTDQLSTLDKPFSHYALISQQGIHRSWPKTIRMDDDDLGFLADEFEKARIEITQEFSDEDIARLAKLTGVSVEEFNAKQMNNQFKGIVEIDLFGEGGESWLAKDMGAFVSQNVDLISSIPDEYLNQVQKIISTSVRGGVRVEDIAAELDDRYDISTNRARLIARDQVGKFNGQLTEARQKDLGIEEYIRRGVGDARERDSHRILNNETFRWDDPPEVGAPGEDIQCRCWAEPSLAKFYEDDDT